MSRTPPAFAPPVAPATAPGGDNRRVVLIIGVVEVAVVILGCCRPFLLASLSNGSTPSIMGRSG